MKTGLSKVMLKVFNKQFEIIGVKMTFDDLPEDGMVEVGKKKEIWWNVYKITELQEKVWKAWTTNELRGNLLEQAYFPKMDLIYGFVRKYEKGVLV